MCSPPRRPILWLNGPMIRFDGSTLCSISPHDASLHSPEENRVCVAFPLADQRARSLQVTGQTLRAVFSHQHAGGGERRSGAIFPPGTHPGALRRRQAPALPQLHPSGLLRWVAHAHRQRRVLPGAPGVHGDPRHLHAARRGQCVPGALAGARTPGGESAGAEPLPRQKRPGTLPGDGLALRHGRPLRHGLPAFC